MAFKLSSEKRAFKHSGNVTFKKKNFKDGTIAEANMDGSITIDKNLDVNSPHGKRVIKHEKKHLEQIKSGKGTYTDKFVTWKGEKYARKDGKIFYKLKWYDEGDDNLPWEKEAVEAEGKKSTKKITDGRAQSAVFQKNKIDYGI